MFELVLLATLGLPYVEVGGCPGETCSLGPVTATGPVPVFAREGDTHVPAFYLKKGDRAIGIKSDVYVNRFGVAIVQRPFQSFKRGQKIQMLSYWGEGVMGYLENGVARTKGPFLFLNPEKRTLEDEDKKVVARLTLYPDFTWWVKIKTSKGRTGWLALDNVADDGVSYAAPLEFGPP